MIKIFTVISAFPINVWALTLLHEYMNVNYGWSLSNSCDYAFAIFITYLFVTIAVIALIIKSLRKRND